MRNEEDTAYGSNEAVRKTRTAIHYFSTDTAPELRILLSQNTSAGAAAVRASSMEQC